MTDDFDSMTRSADDEFHDWAADDDYISEDVDIYEACDRAWAEAKSQSDSTISELEAERDEWRDHANKLAADRIALEAENKALAFKLNLESMRGDQLMLERDGLKEAAQAVVDDAEIDGGIVTVWLSEFNALAALTKGEL